jgi:hypothetical protein
MKARLLFVVLAMVGVGCAASGDSPGVTKKDSGKISESGGDEDTGTVPDDDTGTPGDSSMPSDDTGTEPVDDTGTSPIDTGTSPIDTGTSPIDTGTSPIDTGTPIDSGTTGTTGTACSSDATCDPLGTGDFICSKGAFGATTGGNDLYPTNVCIGISCDPGDGTSIMGCDSDAGVCLASGTSGICLGACSFDDSTTAPTGCVGKDACNVYGWGADSTGKTIGVGYCFGGCKADADCGSGQACQKEEGLCVASATKVTYTKSVGTACTDADSTSTPAKCNCLYATASKKGYCSQFCTMGSSGDCPTGYSCDAQLPKTKVLSTDTVFTAAPTGMAGYCLKNCTTDADCTAINGYCDQTAGVASKTCQIGVRRCSSTAPCPTGKTCSGATATVAGTCI